MLALFVKQLKEKHATLQNKWGWPAEQGDGLLKASPPRASQLRSKLLQRVAPVW